MPVFDVDALAGEYQPVQIVFRGTYYELGVTTEQVLKALGAARSVPDEAPPEQQIVVLPAVLAALNPNLGAVVGDGSALTVGERIVLQNVVKEVIRSVSNVPFRPREG